jgi:hypothetical protein
MKLSAVPVLQLFPSLFIPQSIVEKANTNTTFSLRSNAGHLQSEAGERRIWGRLVIRTLVTRAVAAAFLKMLKDLEFIAQAEKTRMTLNPIFGSTLHNVIVEGLPMPAALKEKLKPIRAPNV